MNGLAITIIVGQLPKLCGFSTDATSFGGEIVAWFEHLDETETAALVVGVAVLVVLLVLPRLTSRVPAVLVAVVGATVRLGRCSGSRTTSRPSGTLPSGFPKPTFPWTSIDDVVPLVVAAVGITLVSLTDTIATSASFAARRGEDVDPNQEMIGLGAANLTAGFLQGFAVSTSGSRTAVAEQSGREEPADRSRRRGPRRHAPRAVPVVARRPPAVGARRGGDRRRAVAAEPRRSPPLRVGAAIRARCSR